MLVVDGLAIAALVGFVILVGICLGLAIWVWRKAATAPDSGPIDGMDARVDAGTGGGSAG